MIIYGYYVQFCIIVDIQEDSKHLESTKNCTGIDVGLKYFYADSNREASSVI